MVTDLYIITNNSNYVNDFNLYRIPVICNMTMPTFEVNSRIIFIVLPRRSKKEVSPDCSVGAGGA